MASATRQKSEVFLIGLCDIEPLTRLKQLPTSKQVLQRFHHFHQNETKSVRNACHLTIEEVVILWCMAAVPITLKKHAIEKLEKLHSSWLLLKKNKGRFSEAQRLRELEYVNKIDTLFDIAHADALTMIRIQEDRDFLLDQRLNRKAFMAAEDRELAKKQDRALLRQKEEEERRQKAILKVATTSHSASATSEFSLDDIETDISSSETDSDDEFQPPASISQFKTPNPSPCSKESNNHQQSEQLHLKSLTIMS